MGSCGDDWTLPSQLPPLPSQLNHPRQPPPLFDQFTPASIFFIFAIFLLIKVLYLIRISKITRRFEQGFSSNSKISSELDSTDLSSTEFSPTEATMTSLFYTIIDHMDLIRKISLVLYIVFILYLQWYIRYFLKLFGFVPSTPTSRESIMHLLNFIDQIGL